MDPIISLPFSENIVVNELEKTFSKKEGYSILIPSTRQQKGFDIVVFNKKSNKCITIQIKGSRTYTSSPPKRETTSRYKNYTWFNKFKIDEELSDYYILVGLFIVSPELDKKSRRIKKSNWYDFFLLLLSYKEMVEFLGNLTQKRNDKPDTSFGFGFNDKKRIALTRGAKEHIDFSDNIFSNRVEELKQRLGKN